MGRKTFLSREFFVDALEQPTKASILSIPAFANNVQLVTQHKLIDTLRFTYEEPLRQAVYYMDVSVLPLNEKFTRVCLHASYSNGHAFNADNDMAMALQNFESAIKVALKGDVTAYKPTVPKPKVSKRMVQNILTFCASISVFLLKRKLS